MQISHISQCTVELEGLYHISHLSQYDICFVPLIDSDHIFGYPGFFIHIEIYDKSHMQKIPQSIILIKVIDLLL